MSRRACWILTAWLCIAVQPLMGQLTETAGPFLVASPAFFSDANSGTYYNPSVVVMGNYAFLFTQGGQFNSNNSSPVPKCGGDKLILWRAPLSQSGVESDFTQIQRVSPCHSTSTHMVHWSSDGSWLSTATEVNIIMERLVIELATRTKLGSEVWWFRGTFNGSDNITNWQYRKLFDVDPSVQNGIGRLGGFAMAFDQTRTAPVDGYTHELYRGFVRVPPSATGEARLDISQRYCDDGTTSAIDACMIVEFKSGGQWRKVQNGYLDFTPDFLKPAFRPHNIYNRNGTLELWGTAIVSAPGCPCDHATSNTGARHQWFTIDRNTFALVAGPFNVNSNVRCMPAEPAASRLGADLLRLSSGRTYLFSSQNDDALCAPDPFVGVDIVTTLLQ